MSVINTMLQDLERRNAQAYPAGSFRYVRPLAPERAPGRTRGVWVVAGLGVALLLIGAFALWKPGAWRLASDALQFAPGAALPATAGGGAEAGAAGYGAAVPARDGLGAVSALDPAAGSGKAATADAAAGIALAVSHQLMRRERSAQPEGNGVAALSRTGSAVAGSGMAGGATASSIPAGSPVRGSAVAGSPISTSASAARDDGTGAVAPAPLAAKLSAALAPRARAPVLEDGAATAGIKQVSPQQRAENAFRLGSEWLHHGDSAQAAEQFTQALGFDAAHDAARQALAGVLLRANKTTEAERLLVERLALASNHPGFALLLARLQVERGATAVAIETLLATLPAVRSNSSYHATLAALLARQGQHAQAVTQYQAALLLAPQSGVWWMGLGLSLQAAGSLPEAQEALRRARASNDLTPDIAAYVDQRLKQLQ